MITLAVVHLDAFGFEQLLPLYVAEIPCKQEEQAVVVISDGYVFDVDLYLGLTNTGVHMKHIYI